jgi:hypothetical protein
MAKLFYAFIATSILLVSGCQGISRFATTLGFEDRAMAYQSSPVTRSNHARVIANDPWLIPSVAVVSDSVNPKSSSDIPRLLLAEKNDVKPVAEHNKSLGNWDLIPSSQQTPAYLQTAISLNEARVILSQILLESFGISASSQSDDALVVDVHKEGLSDWDSLDLPEKIQFQLVDSPQGVRIYVQSMKNADSALNSKQIQAILTRVATYYHGERFK